MKAPKHIITVARGYNGIEQVTIQSSTNNDSEIKALVDNAASAFDNRTAHYMKEQEKFEALTKDKVEAAKKADDANQLNNKKKDK